MRVCWLFKYKYTVLFEGLSRVSSCWNRALRTQTFYSLFPNLKDPILMMCDPVADTHVLFCWLCLHRSGFHAARAGSEQATSPTLCHSLECCCATLAAIDPEQYLLENTAGIHQYKADFWITLLEYPALGCCDRHRG